MQLFAQNTPNSSDKEVHIVLLIKELAISKKVQIILRYDSLQFKFHKKRKIGRNILKHFCFTVRLVLHTTASWRASELFVRITEWSEKQFRSSKRRSGDYFQGILKLCLPSKMVIFVPKIVYYDTTAEQTELSMLYCSTKTLRI